MDAAATWLLERIKEEPVESARDNEKLQKDDGKEQEEVEYKCADCEYSALCWAA